jgi:hypothetical protein
MEVTSEPRVFMRHIRAAKLCAGGTRAWFAKYGIPWGPFLESGVPAETLLATGDPLALKPVQQARAEANG